MAAFGALAGVIVGAVLGALLPWFLQRESANRGEIRDVRMALLETRSVVWDGQRTIEDHIGKLAIRLHTIGFDRKVLEEVRAAAIGILPHIVPAYSVGLDDGEIPPDAKVVMGGVGFSELDEALERADEVLAAGPPRRRKANVA